MPDKKDEAAHLCLAIEMNIDALREVQGLISDGDYRQAHECLTEHTQVTEEILTAISVLAGESSRT